MKCFYLEWTKAAIIGWLFVLFLSIDAVAQKQAPKGVAPAVKKPAAVTGPKVTLVDEVSLKPLLVAKGKPLLVNFWATWCDPCREEFPDLVKLDNEFKGKIDFITVSLDDPDDIATGVPKFLALMKAEMPTFLLKTADESSVITSISKAWHGGMPFTILYDAAGAPVYEREGKVHLDVVRPQIEKLVNTKQP